jgi:hypothetical protein
MEAGELMAELNVTTTEVLGSAAVKIEMPGAESSVISSHQWLSLERWGWEWSRRLIGPLRSPAT